MFTTPSELFARCQATIALPVPNDQWRLEHRQTPLGNERVAVHPQTGVAVRIQLGPLPLLVLVSAATCAQWYRHFWPYHFTNSITQNW